jgi:hypothetical protein
MTKVSVITYPYQGQVVVDGESAIAPLLDKIITKDTIQVATQNQLQGMEFDHWEVDDIEVSKDNPAMINLPKKGAVEIVAVFKKP